MDPIEAAPRARLLDVGAAFDRSHYASLESRSDRLALPALEQWPAQSPSVLACLVRGHPWRMSHSLTRLTERSLVYHHSEGTYAPSDAWLHRAALRDRVNPRAVVARSGERQMGTRTAGRIRQHERGLAHLMSQFRAGGCPVAVGWRGREVSRP